MSVRKDGGKQGDKSRKEEKWRKQKPYGSYFATIMLEIELVKCIGL